MRHEKNEIHSYYHSEMSQNVIDTCTQVLFCLCNSLWDKLWFSQLAEDKLVRNLENRVIKPFANSEVARLGISMLSLFVDILWNFHWLHVWATATLTRMLNQSLQFKHVIYGRFPALFINWTARQITHLSTCAPSEDSYQSALARSMIRFFVVHTEYTLHPWLSKTRPVKILIRLRECAD